MTADATPGGKPVPLGTRKLAFAQTSPLASAEKLLRRCPCSAKRSLAARLG